MNQSSKSLFVWRGFLLFILFVPGLYIAHFAVVKFFDDSSKRMVAKFSSPTNPTNNIFFVEQGFRQRLLVLYASSDGQKTQRVADVELDGVYHFSHAQWTKDGQAVVCFLNLWSPNETTQEGIAYDFNVNKIIGPLLINYNATDTNKVSWKESGLTLQQIIDAHGGLDDQRINDDEVRENENLSFNAQDFKPQW